MCTATLRTALPHPDAVGAHGGGLGQRGTETASDADRVAAFRSMAAYSGKHTIEGTKWTTKADVAWKEAFKKSDQTRFFRIEGDKLHIESPPVPNLNYGNKLTNNIIVWEREK
jgi:hypothetical protein